MYLTSGLISYSISSPSLDPFPQDENLSKGIQKGAIRDKRWFYQNCHMIGGLVMVTFGKRSSHQVEGSFLFHFDARPDSFTIGICTDEIHFLFEFIILLLLLFRVAVS